MATLTIPAAYLEAVRSAVVREVVSDTDMLRVNHDNVACEAGNPQDRSSAADALSRDMNLLAQTLAASGKSTLEGNGEDLAFVLEQMVHVIATRIDEQKEFGPMNMGAVLELAEQLRWTAMQAIRIDSSLDERTAA